MNLVEKNMLGWTSPFDLASYCIIKSAATALRFQ
jgi:hypothetical protein